MIKVVGVQFEKNGKCYYFDTNGLDPIPGHYVVCDTSRGMDLGEVVVSAREIDTQGDEDTFRKLMRIATEQDIQRSMGNRQKEREAFEICQKKIGEHKLEMKLVSVEYSFDGSKILFYFTANGRVDFRSLVKDLASVFKMRIELRQIGVRDEAKMLGGLGPCGRPICCGSFLEQFQPVSIKMAKEQNLSLNPTKISGVCGRLMCCLKYEQDYYEQTRKKMPRIGRTVVTPDGAGCVTELNILKETVMVRMTNGDTSEIKEYPLASITRPNDNGKTEEPAARPVQEIPDITDEIPEDLDALTDSSPETVPQKKVRESAENDSTQVGNTQAGNRDNRQNHPLGQPVKRENPNRNNKKGATGGNKPENMKNQTEKKTAKGKKSWAEAVEEAMSAIDKE